MTNDERNDEIRMTKDEGMQKFVIRHSSFVILDNVLHLLTLCV